MTGASKTSNPLIDVLHKMTLASGEHWFALRDALIAGIEKQTDELAEARAEVERLEVLVYVPGVWRCAKCNLTLISHAICYATGRLGANTSPQKCPNGCGPLWRRTERDAGNDLCDRLDSAFAEVERLRALLAQARRVVDVCGSEEGPEQRDIDRARGLLPLIDAAVDAAVDAARKGKAGT